jgi:hypothetical protein
MASETRVQPRRGAFYVPPDLEEAFQSWGANCGPASLAALLGVPCARVRPWLPEFTKRRYVNPTHVGAALVAAGCSYRPSREWPSFGLAFIQWGGPWLKPGVPIGAAYARTHWIGCDGEAVFDVNAGGWVTRETWEDPENGVAAWLLREGAKGNDGTWSVRTALEVVL